MEAEKNKLNCAGTLRPLASLGKSSTHSQKHDAAAGSYTKSTLVKVYMCLGRHQHHRNRGGERESKQVREILHPCSQPSRADWQACYMHFLLSMSSAIWLWRPSCAWAEFIHSSPNQQLKILMTSFSKGYGFGNCCLQLIAMRSAAQLLLEVIIHF